MHPTATRPNRAPLDAPALRLPDAGPGALGTGALLALCAAGLWALLGADRGSVQGAPDLWGACLLGGAWCLRSAWHEGRSLRDHGMPWRSRERARRPTAAPLRTRSEPARGPLALDTPIDRAA